jgi:protein O-mannosyl-transferase
MRSGPLAYARGSVILIVLCAALGFADTKEEPVGLVLSATGTKLLRADTETPLAARPGDLLFSGDGLRTETGPASFLFCPAKSLDTLMPAGEVRLDAKATKVKSGKISEQPARACTLPQSLRVATASQQHYGVSMTRGLSTEVTPTPHDKLAADVQAELAAYEPVLAANPKDQAALVAEATIFENHKLNANALDMYNKLREQWPDAVWIKSKIFELEQALADQTAAAAATAQTGGQTYALLVGISKYAKPELSLQFANADASVFGKLLESPLGGGVPGGNILLLTDERATTAAVRNGFQDFLKRRAGKNDTVVILIAGHGTVEIPGSKNAFILTYDSDPQDLKSTALAVDELQTLFQEQLSKVGRVLLFVDVCKAGTVGTIHNTTVSSNVQQLGDIQGDLFGLLASRPREVSLEGPEFGGGHGVFSYYVIKGLEGAADANKDGIVDADELIKYVGDQVPMATMNKQHPREFGTYDNMMRLSDTRKAGIQIAQSLDVAHWRVILDSRNGGPLYLAGAPQGQVAGAQASQEMTDRLTSAINAGRILPTDPNNAFTALRDLKAAAAPEQYQELQNQLRIALENKAQQVLLRYLEGDETPQSRDEFQSGARYMDAARMLTQESLFLEGREDFFQGRALLFDKKFPEAASLLEQAVRIDPGTAYGFNALGIAYLEQAQYDKAIPAFHDAVRRAQHWSYPLHNEALAYVETGDYRSAIRAYQEAMRLAPQYSYLPYNLGLVYQRLNRRKDAETAYIKAEMLAPNSAEPYNALGTLKASEGKRADAERLYQQALKADPKLLAARHNLALLVEDQQGRRAEAIQLWRQNLTQSPDYLPSRLSLAGALATAGDNAGAIEEYRKVLAAKPEYVAAHNALADLLTKTGDRDGALEQLRQVSKQNSQDPDLFERIGDLETARQHPAAARAAYQSALSLKPARVTRKRVENKLKSVAGK